MKVEVPDGRLLGAHMSVAGGLSKAFSRGESTGCTAIQIFIKNQHRWNAPELTNEEIKEFKKEKERTGIFCFAHAAYLPNLASPKSELLEKSIDAIIAELKRCDALNIPFLVFHPGSHTTGSRKEGINRVARSLRNIFHENEIKASLVLEITAGQGTNLGSNIEELDEIMEKSEVKDHLGICFDTCHAFAAGYDIRSLVDYDELWENFDRLVGMDMLKALHLNDSLGGPGSHKDRHAHIGHGEIGHKGFRNIINDKRLNNLPMVLETPKKLDDDSDKEMDPVNLRTLIGLIED